MGTSTISNGEIFGRHAGANCGWPASAMELVTRTYSIPLSSCVVWNSGQPLPAAATADDLGLDFSTGISSSISPVISTGDVKATSSTRYAAFPIILPDRYEAAKSLSFNIYAGAKTTVADTSMDLDLQVFLSDGDGTANADIVGTAEQDMNSVTAATFTFATTATNLEAGSNLWGLLSIAYVDSATGTAVIGQIGKIDMVVECRG